MLTLGVFHFNFPNLDVQKVEKTDQIDILNTKCQKEILAVVEKLAQFKPTVIVIEHQPKEQPIIDSLYLLYLQGKYNLNRPEEEQIGFRLAKRMGLDKLYCVDEWGDQYPEMFPILNGTDEVATKEFEEFYMQNPDSLLRFRKNNIYKTEGILAELKMLNDPEIIKKSLGNYLIGIFKYESRPGDFLGTKFETGRWFNRNLKIYRNIQRIPVNSNDRILVIFGADHMNVLNLLFDSSPEYNRVQTNQYL